MFKGVMSIIVFILVMMGDMSIDDLLLCILVMLIGIWAEIGGEE